VTPEPAALARSGRRIWTKLLAGFAVLLLATFALAGYTINGIRAMNALIHQTYDNVFMASTFAQNAHTAFVTLDHAIDATLWAPTLHEFDLKRSRLSGLENEVSENLKVVRERTLIPATRAGIDEIEPLYAAWLARQRTAMEATRAALASPGSERTAADRGRAGTDLLKRIEDHLTLLVDREAEAGFGLREAARDVGARTLQGGYVFVALVVALSAVGLFVLVQRILRPLRDAHAESEQLFASMSWILVAVNRDDRITRWNVAAETSFGIPPASAIGRRIQELAIPWEWSKVEGGLAEARRSGESAKIEDVPYTRPDGAEGFLRLTWNPLEGGVAGAGGILLLGADITERLVLEAQLAQAQKLESIGQLAAGVAHEINTPIQFIGDNARFVETAFADLDRVLGGHQRVRAAAAEGPVPPELFAEVDRIEAEVEVEFLRQEVPGALAQTRDGVDRVATIVRALKQFAHPERTEMTPANLNQALMSTLTVTQGETRYVADVETEWGDIPLVTCCVGELNQVFLNIIVNAAHAVAEHVKDSGGRGTIRVETRREGPHVAIAISDTGGGIPERVRDKIFDPFFTTRQVGKGTGQGLAIAHNLVVNKHRGSIDFHTEMGRGTTFYIRLPIDPGSEDPDAPAPLDAVGAGAPGA